ncbi:MAG: hypothetical protein KC931_25675, partial [Candidatus Omnitrophica bacterium]|nr:hypothetical protein [Candidatus Omnitrophota bacterium]
DIASDRILLVDDGVEIGGRGVQTGDHLTSVPSYLGLFSSFRSHNPNLPSGAYRHFADKSDSNGGANDFISQRGCVEWVIRV